MDLSTLSTERIEGAESGASTQRVAATVYRLLARGRPVSPRHAAALAAVPLPEVEAVLEDWGGTRRDDNGDVVAFGGLDLEPTAHAMTIAGTSLYTWCAWDTLFIPLILDVDATVESRTPDGGSVTLTMGPSGVRDLDPGTAVLSLVQPPETGTSEVRERFCSQVMLFPDEEAGRRWADGRDDVVLVSVEEGARLGRRHAEAVTGGLGRSNARLLELRVHHDSDDGLDLPPHAEGEPVGQGTGQATGSIEGRLRWALAERVGDGLCAMNLFAAIDTSDGATVELEGQGFARLRDPAAQRWDVAGALHLTSEDPRYSWLGEELFGWDGEADLSTGTAAWNVRF